MPLHVASTGSVVAFSLICAAVVSMALIAARRASPERAPRFALAWGGWLLLALGIPLFVPINAAVFPLVGGFLIASNALALALGLSSLGRAVALSTPLWALVGFQAFRLPLELVLHVWAEAEVIPAQMSWGGENLDVITGVVAALAGPLLWWLSREGEGTAAKAVAWGANVVGIGLLLNVARVAVRSVPGPLKAYAGEPLVIAWHIPGVWIVPICVAGALAGHVVLTRRLLAGGRDT